MEVLKYGLHVKLFTRRADWLEIGFLQRDRNSELARAVDVMTTRAKRIYLLMVKVNKLFSFFLFRYFCVYLSETLGEPENAMETLTSWFVFPRHFSTYSQTSPRTSITRYKHGTCC